MEVTPEVWAEAMRRIQELWQLAEALKTSSDLYVQCSHEEIARLRRLCEAHGIDPDQVLMPETN